MFCLSIRQPWAWLLIRPDLTDPKERAAARVRRAVKDIENRRWPIPRSMRLPFRCAIHAGKTLSKWCYEDEVDEWPEISFPPFAGFQLGGIIGTVTITACVTEYDSPWFEGPFGFVLADPRPCAFVPWTGRLGFFNIDEQLLKGLP